MRYKTSVELETDQKDLIPRGITISDAIELALSDWLPIHGIGAPGVPKQEYVKSDDANLPEGENQVTFACRSEHAEIHAQVEQVARDEGVRYLIGLVCGWARGQAFAGKNKIKRA